jgi:hypothetical protein
MQRQRLGRSMPSPGNRCPAWSSGSAHDAATSSPRSRTPMSRTARIASSLGGVDDGAVEGIQSRQNDPRIGGLPCAYCLSCSPQPLLASPRRRPGLRPTITKTLLRAGLGCASRATNLQQITGRAGQAIKAGDNQHVLFADVIEQTRELRPIARSAGHFFLEDPPTPRFLQRGALKGEVLVVSTDPGVADEHVEPSRMSSRNNWLTRQTFCQNAMRTRRRELFYRHEACKRKKLKGALRSAISLLVAITARCFQPA